MGKITLYITRDLEQVWKEFKIICAREDDSASKKISAMIARYVAVHAKGNPQLMLETFIGPTTKICWRCRGKFPKLITVKFISGIIRKLCSTCFEAEKAKGGYCTIKKVLK